MSRHARGDHLASRPGDSLPMRDREGAASSMAGAPVQAHEVQAYDTLDRLAIWLAAVSAEASLAGNSDR